MNGRIVHFEIPFDDGDRARSFYADVFGWTTQEMPEMQYTMAVTGPIGDDGMPERAGIHQRRHVPARRTRSTCRC